MCQIFALNYNQHCILNICRKCGRRQVKIVRQGVDIDAKPWSNSSANQQDERARKMIDDKYIGRYRIGQSPNSARMKAHNSESWINIEKAINKGGGRADFDALSIAVKGHKSGREAAPHPYQFVIYCINRGWLERI